MAPPDKSPGVDGISNRMLQAGGPQFQKTLCLLIKTIWEVEIYPYDWSKALVQPIYKGDAKPRGDPASYRGIYLTCMTTKLFEGILNHRLTEFTTRQESLTPYQFGSKKGFQTHDAIYTLLATIRNNQQFDKTPTYCAFIDFSTAYPSVTLPFIATDYRAFSMITTSKAKCGGSLQVHITWFKSGSSIPSWVPPDLPLFNEAYQKGSG